MLLQERAPAPTPTPPRREPTGRRQSWVARHRALLALTALAAAVRFTTLGAQSYWLDESQAAHELSLSLPHMLAAWNVAEWNPPLYLLLAWPWARVFGTGAVGLRAFSAVCGTALIPVLYVCGRELGSRRAGLVAAAFAALNPFMIWYAQEAREYMLLTLLCAGSLCCYARCVRTGTRRALAWWAVLSALALLTQYFAGFLIAAEGVVLVSRLRSRVALAALVAQALVLVPFLPHVSPQLHTPAGFIVSQPLAIRLQQVPVTFALNTLYKGPLVQWGLIGGGVLAALVIGLLLAGGSDRELRGAGLAAIPAAAVLLVPLLLAAVGHDDFIARGLMPAWPALAVVIAIACTTRGAVWPGAALAAVLLALFVWGGVRIDTDPGYQRPDWRGVAGALGAAPAGTRAIVAYPGEFATGPLSVYLRGTPWDGPGRSPDADLGPATVGELDVVANGAAALSPAGRRASGVRLLSRRIVDGYLVARFRLPAPVAETAGSALALADRLLADPSPGAQVMLQTRAAGGPIRG